MTIVDLDRRHSAHNGLHERLLSPARPSLRHPERREYESYDLGCLSTAELNLSAGTSDFFGHSPRVDMVLEPANVAPGDLGRIAEGVIRGDKLATIFYLMPKGLLEKTRSLEEVMRQRQRMRNEMALRGALTVFEPRGIIQLSAEGLRPYIDPSELLVLGETGLGIARGTWKVGMTREIVQGGRKVVARTPFKAEYADALTVRRNLGGMYSLQNGRYESNGVPIYSLKLNMDAAA